MDSLFKNLLSIVSSEQVPLEDFFTEIFAYLLKSHVEILEAFLTYFSLSKIEDWQASFVATQETFFALPHHSVDSRPDIYIELSTDTLKEILLIECKLDAGEGNDQLKRYAEQLDHVPKLSSGTIIYITRDYDREEQHNIFKDCTHVHRLHFIQLRWYHIYTFLRKWRESFLVQEVLTFMEMKNMALSNQFNMVDLSFTGGSKTLYS